MKSFHLIGKRNIIAVYIGKKISLLRLSGYQSDRIPLISSALNGSLIVCFYHIFVVAYIIEDRFTVPGSMNRFQHSVDICLYAVLAGLMEARANNCDITISIDCDGQDDINAMDEMVQKYLDGAEVVYGVRSRRDTDTFFKRFTAEGFYHLMNALGADIVFNHADYRLISARVLDSFADYKEVNIFLRGMVPLVGFQSEQVFYERHERLAGESHYPLRKMLALAFDGITSLSNKPIRLITGAGIVVSLISFIGVIWAIVQAAMGSVVAGWASTICIVCFVGGVQLVCLGVIGEYIGKIYMETKARPRYMLFVSAMNSVPSAMTNTSCGAESVFGVTSPEISEITRVSVKFSPSRATCRMRLLPVSTM